MLCPRIPQYDFLNRLSKVTFNPGGDESWQTYECDADGNPPQKFACPRHPKPAGKNGKAKYVHVADLAGDGSAELVARADDGAVVAVRVTDV